MPYTPLGKSGASEVAHELMHLNHDASVVFKVKRQRFHLRVNLAPLFFPISAHLLRAANKAAFERPWPGDVRCHEGDGGGDVPRIEGRIGCAEQRGFW